LYLIAKKQNMDLETLALSFEIVSSLAVLISIIYLAQQVKQGTKSLKTSMRDASFHSLMEWNYHVMSDNDLAWVFSTGCKDFNSLNEFHKPRWLHMLYSFFKVFENIYLHYLDKSVESNVWEHNYKIFVVYFNTPGVQFYWNERREMFDPRFISFVENKHDSVMLSMHEMIDKSKSD
jgi:hypothetical protein